MGDALIPNKVFDQAMNHSLAPDHYRLLCLFMGYHPDPDTPVYLEISNIAHRLKLTEVEIVDGLSELSDKGFFRELTDGLWTWGTGIYLK